MLRYQISFLIVELPYKQVRSTKTCKQSESLEFNYPCGFEENDLHGLETK